VSPCAFDFDEQLVPALFEVCNSFELTRAEVAVTLMLAEDQFVVHPDAASAAGSYEYLSALIRVAFNSVEQIRYALISPK